MPANLKPKVKTKIITALIFITALFIEIFYMHSPANLALKSVKNSVLELRKRVSAFASATIPDNYYNLKQYNLNVKHYYLKLDLYPQKKLLIADAIITGEYKFPTDTIYLNFTDNYKVNSLKLNKREIPLVIKDYHLIIPNFDASDSFSVHIKYEGTPKKAGLSAFTFAEKNNSSIIYTINEPVYASTWFPCNDLPDDKSLLDIEITNDSSMVSVSNGKLVEIKNNGSRKTYHWKTFYPISTYLIAVYSANYKQINDVYISEDKKDTLDLNYFVTPGNYENAKFDFAVHKDMIEFFSKTFGKYPFMKEKYGVAEFLWPFGAMENQTITGLGSNFISGKNFFKFILAHELAHHWWGNAVGLKNWNDIWLNEGFATYSEALYAEHLSGEDALQAFMLGKAKFNTENKLYNSSNDNIFNSTVYNKGAWILHMLRNEVGDSVFFNSLKDYFETYKYKSVSTEDFEKIVEKNFGKSLKYFFNQWVFYDYGIIKLLYNWNVKKDKDLFSVNLIIEQIQKKHSAYVFPLEIEFEFDKGNKIIKRIYIDSLKENITLSFKNKPNKILPDPSNKLLAEFTLQNNNK